MTGVLVGMILALVVLCIVIAIMADALIRAHSALSNTEDAKHAACIAHIADVTSARFGAVILRDLADRYESPAEVPVLNRIKREQWKSDGPMLPALWLRHHANEMEKKA